MSQHAHSIHPPTAETFDRKKVGILPTLLMLGAAAGLVGSAAGAFLNPKQFAFSWLFAFTYFFTISAGALFWVLVHHAVDAEWSVVVRRVLEHVANLIPVTAILFVPTLFFAPMLWKWWTLHPGQDALLDMKSAYLNQPFFLVRAAFFFVALSTLAYLMRKYSSSQDQDGAAVHTFKMRRVAFAGIPLFAVSLTFGAFDWLMGLDYTWFSTMWGVYIFAGCAGSAMSLLVLLITALLSLGYLRGVITKEHYHIMGKLMLAFTVFWAYIGFSQYMLIWYSNIPEETSYFIRRNVGTWNALSTFLVVGRFFLPFPILLLQATKRHPKWLCLVACWILFMQMVDIYIIVMPMLHQTGVAPSWIDLVSILGIGCTLALVLLKALGSRSLFPVRDPRLLESIALTN